MVKPLYCCLFLPVTLLAALCTDTRIRFKFVCIGDSVEVFQNISSASLKTEITFYKIFDNQSHTIAVWVMENFRINDTIHSKYSQKVSLENGTIMLQDFQASDEAAYVMLYQNSSKRKTVELCALVPPTLRCKPNIKHEENFLIATLDNSEYCGKPLASVRWMENPNIFYINKARIKLPPGKEAGTYRACIEGETLKCLKNTFGWDNCENITIGYTRESREYCENVTTGSTRENESRSISDIPQLKTTSYVIVVLVSLGLFGVIAILIKLFWKRSKKPTSVDTEEARRNQLSFHEPQLQVDGAGQYNVESIPDDQEREPFVPARDIELQVMGNVHH